MKRIIFLLTILLVISLAGCKKVKTGNVVESLGNKVNDLDSYTSKAVMEVTKNNETKQFNVEVTYQRPDNYKVKLQNLDNNISQVIVKNQSGVYVLTPTLNKSFKFQSDWPQNTSHSYLFQSIVKDALNDQQPIVTKDGDNFLLETTVDYKTDTNLKTQKIVLDKDLKPKEVTIFDEQLNPRIRVVFSEFKENVSISDDAFNIDKIMQMAIFELGEGYETYSNRQITYPTYFPIDTYLDTEDISLTDGMMTFANTTRDVTFTVYQEFVDNSQTTSVYHTNYGDPVLLTTGVGVITDTSLTWMNNGIKYVIFSDDLTQTEMCRIANSFIVGLEK